MTLLSTGRVLLLVFVSLTLSDTVARGQRLPMAKPEDVGMSSKRLARVKVAVQQYVDRKDVAGVVTLVARHGRVVHLESVGLRDGEAKAPMTPDTIFRLASMTKPIVSVAAMMLFEEGHFLLSDPISKWMPEFKSMKIIELQGLGMNYRLADAFTPITIRHLLTHTSGLATGSGVTKSEFEKIAPNTVPNDTIGDFVTRLAKLPLHFEPGTKWEYGYATDIVGRLIEIISGNTLDEFLRERIFRPLQMNDTYFYLPETKLPRFAATYRPNSDLKIELAEAPSRDSVYVEPPHTYFSGAGGLISTAADYYRFHQMMLNGGELDGVRLLGRKTVELMTSNHSGELFATQESPQRLFILGNRALGYCAGQGLGLGYKIVTDVGASGVPGSVGQYGWGGAFGTEFFVDPLEDLIGIVMTQIRPYSHLNIRQEFQVLAYQAIVEGAKSPR
jgi:CubicO group peptidase (beta-lactamase class C family)